MYIVPRFQGEEIKRIVTMLSLTIIAFASFLAVAALASQSDLASLEDVVLTTAEGDGWNYAIGADGQPIETMVPMMIDGEPQLDFAPAVLELYENHQL